MCIIITFGFLMTACGSSISEGPSQATHYNAASVILQGVDSYASHTFKENFMFSCMKSAGFEYELQPFVEFDATKVDSREIRADKGFGISTGEGSIFVVESEGELSESPNIQYSGAQVTHLADCRQRAGDELNRKVEYFVDNLDPENAAFLRSVADFDHPLAVEAEQAWSECMSADGYDFTTVSAMYEYAYQTFTSENSLSQEASLAIVDWDCSMTDEVLGKIDRAYEELDTRLNFEFAKVFEEK